MKEFYLDSCGGGRLHCAIWTPEGELASFFSLGLTPAENKAILADNARRVFGIAE